MNAMIQPDAGSAVITRKGIYAALAAAQAEMEPALKNSTNPHLKNKYSNLASVKSACLPALNKHGIAVIQPPYDDETGRYVKTILLHAETGESLECRIPLILQKNDMQGYGSAVTYARRYGLMSMAGIAPDDDDDGNAAAEAAPKGQEQSQRRTEGPAPAPLQQKPQALARISADQFIQVRDKGEAAGVDSAAIAKSCGVERIEEMPADMFERVMARLDKTIAANATAKNADIGYDEIPY